MKLPIFVIIFLGLASCGPGDKDSNYSPMSIPQYCETGVDDLGNKCSTGVHRFTTYKELCEAIQNDNYNSNCAFTERRRFFSQFCDGTFKRDGTPRSPPPFEPCSEVVIRSLAPSTSSSAQ
ncbi:MAG: hypothetical protein A4S09_09885 [Proteobacteria bacterium SG_bin7]|nr:MAG: hypothetical protein A4S09_09885 [Proteobacteria bacterium SG_bin7]